MNNVLQNLPVHTKKWDLDIIKRRATWMHNTEAILRVEEKVWASIVHGRPTLSMVQDRWPETSKNEALAMLKEIESGGNGRSSPAAASPPHPTDKHSNDPA